MHQLQCVSVFDSTHGATRTIDWREPEDDPVQPVGRKRADGAKQAQDQDGEQDSLECCPKQCVSKILPTGRAIILRFKRRFAVFERVHNRGGENHLGNGIRKAGNSCSLA